MLLERSNYTLIGDPKVWLSELLGYKEEIGYVIKELEKVV